ncbi:hypothetical protein [Streptomyces sp. NPDC004065]|uniref:hypothetical protein n=1 Tax=Streptomyces sp. NPDC004065 TaxID=3364689 RepID=UPI00385133EB
MTRTTRAATTAGAVRIAAAGLLGALALTACDSGGSGDDGPAASRATRTADTGGGTGGDGKSGGASGGTTAKAGELDGSWLTTSGGRAVVLILHGSRAALFSTDRTTCSGTVSGAAGGQVIRLDAQKCGARAEGTVDSVNRTTLRVTWKGDLGQESYTRSEGPALPSGLPTASIGS